MVAQRENKKKPKFKRSESPRYKKLSRTGWRKARGRHQKMRTYLGGKPLSPSIGYGRNKEERGIHPSGYREVLVANQSQLRGLDKEKYAVRISGRAGARKAMMIMEESKKLGLKILNPRRKAEAKEEAEKAES